jgi:Zn-dependent M16 (insulinase) family peptidase
LRKILLESGLGDALVGGGVEDELLQPQFSIGLKGVSEEDIEKVEELVMSTLKKLAEEGFETDAVEASMNTIEFSLRENNTGSFPRGLSLMLQSIVSFACFSPHFCKPVIIYLFQISLMWFWFAEQMDI